VSQSVHVRTVLGQSVKAGRRHDGDGDGRAAGRGRRRPASAIAVVATILALVLAGCGSGSGSASTAGNTAAAAASSSGVEKLVADAMHTPPDLANAGLLLNAGEQAARDYMREASGVAGLLGSDGPAILAGMDAAEQQAIAALGAEMQPHALAPGRGSRVAAFAQLPAPARGRSSAARQPSQDSLENLVGAFMVTSQAPGNFAGLERDASGNAVPAPNTSDTTSAHGEKSHFAMQPSVIGCRLTFEVRGSTSAGGSPPYSEDTSGKVVVDLCPDVNGNVALELSLGESNTLNGGGLQYAMKVTMTGHVGDDGRLASIDFASDGGLASQPQAGDTAPEHAPMYVGLKIGYTGAENGGSITNVTSSYRESSRVDRQFEEKAATWLALGRLAAYTAMYQAQDKWTSGYCLQINVSPNGGAGGQTVAPGSTTPFTATVRHKFDKADLKLPVKATLSSGGVSVSPSGTAVTAPAAFSYTAPGDGHSKATVALETRSRRGIATLNVTFTTGRAWTVDFTGADQLSHFKGTICGGLEGPFSLSEKGAMGELWWTMTWAFSPTAPAGGTWTLSGTGIVASVVDLKTNEVRTYPVTYTGHGNYQVTAADSDRPMLNVADGIGVMAGVPGGDQSFHWDPMSIPLLPGGTC
jgi:hypothetical protein